MANHKKRTIDFLIENEKDIARLYRMYARKMKEYGNFWRGIILEEDGHVKMLSDIKKSLGKGEKAFYSNNYSIDIILYISKFVKREIQKSQKGKINPKDAFECALRIEQSIIESRCFDIFVPTKKEIREVLRKINREAKNHARVVQKELKKHLQKTA